MKPPDGLYLLSGDTLFYRRNGVFLMIVPRIVRGIYRDGSQHTVYDLSTFNPDTLGTIVDYGTYFSVEDAIEKCKLVTEPRMKTGIMPC